MSWSITSLKMLPRENFSLEFCIAIGILERKATLSQFVDEKVKDPKILEIMGKVRMNVDPNLSPDGYTGEATVVSLKLKDGTILTRRVDQPKGNPENPLSREELLDKFRSCASLSLNRDSIKRVIEKVLNIEKLNSIRPLMEELAG